MDREEIQTFIRSAETELALVRSSLLIIAQTGDASDLTTARRNLVRLSTDARSSSLSVIADLSSECEASLSKLSGSSPCKPADIYPILDLVARIEAAVFEIRLGPDDATEDFSRLVDATIESITAKNNSKKLPEIEEFEIDEEMLEVFREEASELLANIRNSLETLSRLPGDQNALWEIRRNSHTFKGAAGIVGMNEASAIAHRMEDILDKMVEMRAEAAEPIYDFLVLSATILESVVEAKAGAELGGLDQSYAQAMALISSSSGKGTNEDTHNTASHERSNAIENDIVRTTTTPIVRVSLDRLDELIKLSHSLLFNRSALAERFNELSIHGNVDRDSLSRFESLIETQRELTDEIQAKILKIRMVRFEPSRPG